MERWIGCKEAWWNFWTCLLPELFKSNIRGICLFVFLSTICTIPLVFILACGMLIVPILCLDLQLFGGLEGGARLWTAVSGNSHPVFSFWTCWLHWKLGWCLTSFSAWGGYPWISVYSSALVELERLSWSSLVCKIFLLLALILATSCHWSAASRSS